MRSYAAREVSSSLATLHDAVAVGADHDRGSGLDPFGPLGHFAEHQYRLAQRRRLLLNAAAVGEHQVGAVHQVHELHVVHRLDQIHPRQIAQEALDRLLDLRIGMDRQHELQIGVIGWASSRMAAQVDSSGAPKLSRRWVVTSTSRRPGSSEASWG